MFIAMKFLFIRNQHQRYRFFCTAPPGQVPARLSKAKEIWEKAKEKVITLNPRDLRQEQAFGFAGGKNTGPAEIFHSGLTDEKKLRLKFAFFLQRQRTRHILFLVVESLAVPFSGLAAFLPGPNIIFYVLAIVIIIHWQALRGINRLIHGHYAFVPHPLLADWEKAVAAGDEQKCLKILSELEKTFGLRKADIGVRS